MSETRLALQCKFSARTLKEPRDRRLPTTTPPLPPAASPHPEPWPCLPSLMASSKPRDPLASSVARPLTFKVPSSMSACDTGSVLAWVDVSSDERKAAALASYSTLQPWPFLFCFLASHRVWELLSPIRKTHLMRTEHAERRKILLSFSRVHKADCHLSWFLALT